jgi:hypothetical protein
MSNILLKSRQGQRQRQRKKKRLVLSNDQPITVLEYLHHHYKLRMIEIEKVTLENFGAYLMNDFEIQNHFMRCTTRERHTDIKNKEQEIQKLLLDTRIHIPYHIIEYIILHSTNEGTIKMAINRCENKHQLIDNFKIAYTYDNVLIFSALLNSCEKNGIDFLTTFNLLEALEFSIEHERVEIFTLIINYAKSVFEKLHIQLVDYDMIVQKAIDKHKYFPFKILAECNINKQHIIDCLKDQSKKAYYGNELYSISIFKLIFDSNNYLESIPINLTYTMEIIKSGSRDLKFHMPLFMIKRFIRIILLLNSGQFNDNRYTLPNDILAIITKQIIKLCDIDLHEITNNQFCDESFMWLFNRIKNHRTFDGFWWDSFLERESNYMAFGEFYYTRFINHET